MAKFRDSTPEAVAVIEAAARPHTPHSQQASDADTTVHDHERSIGDIIAELRNLTTEQVEKVLEHQRQAGVRFGEAAVALGYGSKDDVRFALSQQFHYPYAPEEQRHVSPGGISNMLYV